MVVQSIALPKVSGAAREHKLAIVPGGSAALAAEGLPDVHGRILRAVVILPLLVATQAAWICLLGYGVVRVLT